MCGLRTRSRTDVDLPRFLDAWLAAKRYVTVELPSAGAYRLAAPGAIPCLCTLCVRRRSRATRHWCCSTTASGGWSTPVYIVSSHWEDFSSSIPDTSNCDRRLIRSHPAARDRYSVTTRESPLVWWAVWNLIFRRLWEHWTSLLDNA